MSKVKKGSTFPIGVKKVAAITSFVAKAQQQLEGAPSLDTTERLRALKLKSGAQQVVPAIAALVKKYELGTPHVKMDEALSAVTYAASLRALVAPVTLLLQRIKDEILRTEGAAWKSATVSYGMLQKVSMSVPDLATELAGVEEWFRRGHARGKAARAAAATAATPVTAPPAAATVNPPPKA
jgi:hypothetical protein